MKWLTKAAEQGHIEAQHILGGMYYKGEGVIQNYKQGAYWITKAAEQGDVDAQEILGGMYYLGQGVIKNNKIAYIWLAISASKAGGETIEIRDIVAKELTAKELGEAQEEAIKLDDEINNTKP